MYFEMKYHLFMNSIDSELFSILGTVSTLHAVFLETVV